MAVTDLTKALDAAGATYEVLHHEHTERATAEALALGVSPDEVAKTLIVATPTGHVRALVPASRRIDMRKLADALGESRKQLRLATEDEMRRDYPEFELGAVPPSAARARTRSSSTARSRTTPRSSSGRLARGLGAGANRRSRAPHRRSGRRHRARRGGGLEAPNAPASRRRGAAASP